MTLGPFSGKHSLLLCDIAPTNLLGRDLLSKFKGLIYFASNRDLAFTSPDLPEPDLLCSLQTILDIEEEEFQQKSLDIIMVAQNL